ncbi:MAG: hypothetical protein HBSAPP03_20190 [Phycisphaerae bacterium]|nr:MAG: hypothetical protein HBSAPP03_20190 [Phycisphaerae bacterium]
MKHFTQPGLLAACLSLTLFQPSWAQVFGVELVQNGGAEAGPFSPDGYAPVTSIPGWSFFTGVNVVRYQTGGEFPVVGSPGPVQRGQQFFSGGNNSPFSTASQVIDLTAGSEEIDSGQVVFDFRAWLGGAGSQDDTAQVAAVFNDGDGQSIGTSTLAGPFAGERGNQTGLLLRTAAGTVPVGTRSITLALTMIRTNGNYNNGYADNISMVLTAPLPPCDPDVNCDGSANGVDVEIQELAVGGELTDYCQPDADFNRDGAVNGTDVEAVELVVGGAPCP